MTDDESQTVCSTCGYNIIGARPNIYPFCRAEPNSFLSDAECGEAKRFVVK